MRYGFNVITIYQDYITMCHCMLCLVFTTIIHSYCQIPFAQLKGKKYRYYC